MMKYISILLFLLIYSFFVNGQPQPNHVPVRGHYRGGVYIPPHMRTAPNGTNRDNFSTKPNENPYTGKSGYIEPDDKMLQNQYNSYSGATTITGNATNNMSYGRISFWTDYGDSGRIKIFIQGSSIGELNQYFARGNPSCEATGTLQVTLPPGRYKYRAEDMVGYYWEGYADVSKSSCQAVQFHASAKNRFELGFLKAQKEYKPDHWVLWGPCMIAMLDWRWGIGSTMTINLFKPALPLQGKIGSCLNFLFFIDFS